MERRFQLSDLIFSGVNGEPEGAPNMILGEADLLRPSGCWAAGRFAWPFLAVMVLLLVTRKVQVEFWGGWTRFRLAKASDYGELLSGKNQRPPRAEAVTEGMKANRSK